MKKIVLMIMILTTVFLTGCIDKTTSENQLNSLSYYELIPSITLGSSQLNPNEYIREISLGGEHSALFTTDNRLFIWGNNDRGQLGLQDITSQLSPIEITESLSLQNEEMIQSISLGQRHTGVFTSDNRIFVWGWNLYGHLGDGTRTSQSSPVEITNQFVFDAEEKIEEIEFGYTHSSLITSLGKVYIWGNNSSAQLGNGTIDNSANPVNITSFFALDNEEKIVDISLGYVHSLALSSSGRLFAWGNNANGQIGDGTNELHTTPHDITGFLNLNTNEKIIKVSAGEFHSAAITSQGRLFTWGKNNYGQIGNNSLNKQIIPLDITNSFALNENDIFSYLTLGDSYSMAVTESKRVYIWGSLTDGFVTPVETGDYYLIPHELTNEIELSPYEQFISVSSGGEHTALITSKGRLLIWGMNQSGQLGNGNKNGYLLPIDITQTVYVSHLIHSMDIIKETVIPTYLPELDKFIFDGWYTNDTLSSKWNDSLMPDNDVSLYGTWHYLP